MADTATKIPMEQTKQQAAYQRAFEKGMEDFRAGKDKTENHYPVEAFHYAACWEQGWDQEYKASYE